MAEQDKHIGEVYLDTDPRTFQRRIRITGFKGGVVGSKIWPKVVRTFAYEPKPKYRYEVIANAGNAKQVGRKGTISAKTLERRYVKVSH